MLIASMFVAFDVQVHEEDLEGWLEQRTFAVWIKNPLHVRLTSRV